jgi:hypothetical protein
LSAAPALFQFRSLYNILRRLVDLCIHSLSSVIVYNAESRRGNFRSPSNQNSQVKTLCRESSRESSRSTGHSAFDHCMTVRRVPCAGKTNGAPSTQTTARDMTMMCAALILAVLASFTGCGASPQPASPTADCLWANGECALVRVPRLRIIAFGLPLHDRPLTALSSRNLTATPTRAQTATATTRASAARATASGAPTPMTVR